MAAPLPGAFEWCEDTERLKPVLEEALALAAELEGREERTRILVVGCGTSNLSFELWERGLRDVHSIDLDLAVVESMAQAHPGCENLTWQEIDITGTGPNSCACRLLGVGSYHLAVDKGTLDYLLCGELGPALDAVANVHAALLEGGLFLLISIHPLELTKPLLTGDCLGFEELNSWSFPRPATEQVANAKAMATSAVLLRKAVPALEWSTEHRVAAEAAAKVVMDLHFSQEAPLLTASREAELRQRFSVLLREGESQLPLERAHEALFPSAAEREEYSLELFLEDLAADREEQGLAEGPLGLEEALDFLRRNQ